MGGDGGVFQQGGAFINIATLVKNSFTENIDQVPPKIDPLISTMIDIMTQ